MFQVIGPFALLLLAFAGCANFSPIKAPPPEKPMYRATYLASSDGVTFRPVLELLNQAQRAKATCQAINRKAPVAAQYQVERKNKGIQIHVLKCESSQENCGKLVECLYARPVAWEARASGLSDELLGPKYTDWVAQCGGQVSIQFYLGEKAPYPIERVNCVEPRHDQLDTSTELFLVVRPDIEHRPPMAPMIEKLLQRWDSESF